MGSKAKPAPAPDFEMVDSEGETLRLSDYKGKRHIILVFNRGFVCPFCRWHMAQLCRDYREFVRRNARVIVVGPENTQTFSKWWLGHRMPFIGIPDPEHKVANLYGQEFNILKLGRMPEVVVVDKDGNLRLKHKGKFMCDTLSNKKILALLDEINRGEEEG